SAPVGGLSPLERRRLEVPKAIGCSAGGQLPLPSVRTRAQHDIVVLNAGQPLAVGRGRFRDVDLIRKISAPLPASLRPHLHDLRHRLHRARAQVYSSGLRSPDNSRVKPQTPSAFNPVRRNPAATDQLVPPEICLVNRAISSQGYT